MFELMVRMGPLGIPLLLCSIASLAVILERGTLLLRTRLPQRRRIEELIADAQASQWEAFRDKAHHMLAPLGEGASLLIDNINQPRQIRDDLATLWLNGLRRRLTRNIMVLQLIAVISPLLGLLGTVVGMIIAFQDIASYDRPVNPAVIADGLWQAMLTTAFGLMVALPALFFAHLYNMRAARLVNIVEGDLNRLNLSIEMAKGATFPEAKGTP